MPHAALLITADKFLLGIPWYGYCFIKGSYHVCLQGIMEMVCQVWWEHCFYKARRDLLLRTLFLSPPSERGKTLSKQVSTPKHLQQVKVSACMQVRIDCERKGQVNAFFFPCPKTTLEPVYEV